MSRNKFLLFALLFSIKKTLDSTQDYAKNGILFGNLLLCKVSYYNYKQILVLSSSVKLGPGPSWVQRMVQPIN